MTGAKKKTKGNTYRFHPYNDFSELWGLRVLLQLEGWRQLGTSQNNYTSNGTVLQAVGLGHLEDQNITKQEFCDFLNKQQKKTEGKELKLEPALSNNLNLLAQEIGFNPTEIKLLFFSLVLSIDNRLTEVTSCLGELTSESIISILSVVLDREVDDIRMALSPSGMLARSGMLILDRNFAGEISGRLEIFDGSLVLFEPHKNIASILLKFFLPISDGELLPEDFSHLRNEYNLTTHYLNNALASHASGTNILFYGPPGTGKTELAKTIANDIKCEMYEVVITNSHDESLEASRRISAYQLAQHILARKGNRLFLFDEVESVLEHKSFNIFSMTYKDQPSKAAINKLLVPCNI